ncbi:hypothetical protein GGP56_002395 [Salinibacter ruber]|nr:hypothetical protein [Salinibacter ruber]MCS4195629.1 hypothetical protein [Salinibacter ruber]
MPRWTRRPHPCRPWLQDEGGAARFPPAVGGVSSERVAAHAAAHLLRGLLTAEKRPRC